VQIRFVTIGLILEQVSSYSYDVRAGWLSLIHSFVLSFLLFFPISFFLSLYISFFLSFFLSYSDRFCLLTARVGVIALDHTQ
jgi:hypothetical protein